MENGKAPGPDKIIIELKKQFDTKTKQLLLNVLNSCHDKALVPITEKNKGSAQTRQRLKGP